MLGVKVPDSLNPVRVFEQTILCQIKDSTNHNGKSRKTRLRDSHRQQLIGFLQCIIEMIPSRWPNAASLLGSGNIGEVIPREKFFRIFSRDKDGIKDYPAFSGNGLCNVLDCSLTLNLPQLFLDEFENRLSAGLSSIAEQDGGSLPDKPFSCPTIYCDPRISLKCQTAEFEAIIFRCKRRQYMKQWDTVFKDDPIFSALPSNFGSRRRSCRGVTPRRWRPGPC